MVGAGSEGKGIVYYNFGPDYAFPGNCWARGNDSLQLAPQIQTAHSLLAKAEELLWLGQRPAAAVAILAPRSAQPWDDLCTMFDDTCLFGKRANRTRKNLGAAGKCCKSPTNIMDCTNFNQAERTVDYMSEVFGTYHALVQVHNTAVEFIDETTLAHNRSKMGQFSTVILVSSRVGSALYAWLQTVVMCRSNRD